MNVGSMITISVSENACNPYFVDSVELGFPGVLDPYESYSPYPVFFRVPRVSTHVWLWISA